MERRRRLIGRFRGRRFQRPALPAARRPKMIVNVPNGISPPVGPGPMDGRTVIAISRVLSLVFDSVGVTFPITIRIVCSPTPTARNDCEYTVVDAPVARVSP